MPFTDSTLTPCSTLASSLPLILASLLPPVGAVLSAIALWVASRARSTSEDALSTSQAIGHSLHVLPERREHSASPKDAQDQRKS